MAINDLEYTFFFETKEMCTTDGRIPIEKFNIKLVNKKTKKDEQNLYKEKIEKYMDITLNYIKQYIII